MSETVTKGPRATPAELVGMLAHNFMDALEEKPAPAKLGEDAASAALLALIVVRTQEGLAFHAAGAGEPPTRSELLRLVKELHSAIRGGDLREGRRIG